MNNMQKEFQLFSCGLVTGVSMGLNYYIGTKTPMAMKQPLRIWESFKTVDLTTTEQDKII